MKDQKKMKMKIVITNKDKDLKIKMLEFELYCFKLVISELKDEIKEMDLEKKTLLEDLEYYKEYHDYVNINKLNNN